MIDELNIKRKAVYAEKAAAAKATVEEYALTSGCLLISQTRPGEKYQGPDGNWQAQWPPADAPLAGDPQADASASPSELPVRVRFDFGDDDRLDVLLLARHSARAEADDMEVEVD